MSDTELIINIKVGDFTEEIDIQEATTSEDADTGETILTWESYKTARAKCRVLAINEDEKSGAIRSIDTVTFTTYFDTVIDNKMKIVYESFDYDIIQVIPIGRRRFMDLICKKREQTIYLS